MSELQPELNNSKFEMSHEASLVLRGLQQVTGESPQNIVKLPPNLEVHKHRENDPLFYNLGIYRKRDLLLRAYPNYRTRSFSNGYVDQIYDVLPQLFRQSGSPRQQSIETNIRRMQMWVSGLSIYEVAQEESVVPGTIMVWRWKFPRYLKSTVNFYEVVHAADTQSELSEESLREAGTT